MICIQSTNNDPEFNIATEEYLLKNKEEDIFLLYQNLPSVIIGKHQNAFAEINYTYTHQNKIPIIRRLSGGGAVFHDLGNLNFSFITTASMIGDLVNFQKYTSPIIEALNKLGVKAVLGKRNELTINDLKITGTACHIFRNRVLHHGTLLFDANLEILEEVLRGPQDRFQSKAVKSIRSNVANISSLLPSPISKEVFKTYIFSSVMKYFEGSREYNLSNSDISSISTLIKNKFQKWEWNYGYGPRFMVDGTTGKKEDILSILVEKGIIKSVTKKTTDGTPCILEPHNSLLTGKHFTPDSFIIKEAKVSGSPLKPLLKQFF